MDKLESLGSQLSQITMYDIKSYYNQAKNMVLNVSEMEAKVREATNDDPWGASSTLMQDIAQGTFNFQQFNEIMPCIYSRFMEKEARQWREIYKALQLLEYIIKHGSERVVDDTRSHLSTVKMLRNFHYIDDKGKDQGINVRNRATEIASLLSDLDKIRAERRKAKTNKNKYVGTGNDGMGGGGRYDGFGNDSMYGSSGGGYSGNTDYYNSGGGASSSFRDDTGRKGYEEYDAGDYEETPTSRRSNSLRSPTSPSTSKRLGASGSSSQPPRIADTKEKEKEKQVAVDDLLGDWGGDSGFGGSTTMPATQEKALPSLAAPGVNDGDDFDDFQSAPTAPPVAPLSFSQTPAQAQKPTNSKPNVFEFLNQTQTPVAAAPMAPRTQTQPQSPPGWQQAPIQAQPARPNYYGGAGGVGGAAGSNPISPVRSAFSGVTGPGTPMAGATRPPATPAGTGTGKPSANFDDLWSLGLGASKKATSAGAAAGGGATTSKSMKDIEKEKAQAGIWGASQGQGHASQGSVSAFGSFGGSSAGATSVGGGDDLLL